MMHANLPKYLGLSRHRQRRTNVRFEIETVYSLTQRNEQNSWRLRFSCLQSHLDTASCLCVQPNIDCCRSRTRPRKERTVRLLIDQKMKRMRWRGNKRFYCYSAK